jgi:AcrR family transcriptional regulator
VQAAFAESGDAVQIDDVARPAGVGVGTVYRHFPAKQALLTELVCQTFGLFTGRARAALEAGGEPFALIEGQAIPPLTALWAGVIADRFLG